MKSLKCLFLLPMIFICIDAYSQSNPTRDSQWDFFRNVIPRQRSIAISSSTNSGDMSRSHTHNYNRTTTTWRMTIDDNYRVSFSGEIVYELSSQSSSSSARTDWQVKFEGIGFIIWENEKMVIQLPLTGSGSLQRQSERNYNFTYSNASGRSSHNVSFDIQPEYVNGNFSGRIMLSSQTLSLTMTGDTTQSASLTVGGNTWHTATIVPKSESELNISSGDAFGAWGWNTERTRLFLKSENSDNQFVIYNNNGALTWSMELMSGVQGSSENTIETGERIINLAMSIDGTPAQNISFIENNDESNEDGFLRLDYVVFNRFLGTLDRNSVTILNQLKSGHMLIFTYTINGANRTDMFLLEGLSTILEHLN